MEFQDSYSKFTKKIDTHRKNLSSLSLSNEKVQFPSTWIDISLNRSNLKYTENLLHSIESEIQQISLNPETYTTAFSNFTFQTNNSLNLPYDFDFTTNFKAKTYKSFYSKSNINMHDIYYNTNNYFNESTLSDLFFKSTNNFNAYYDFLQLDETTDVDSNTRHHLTTQPFRLLKGVLNQHVVDILQNEKFVNNKLTKLLFLNSKFCQSGESLKDKELLPETLWGFRQKRYKKTKKFKFKPEVIYDPITFQVVGHKALPSSPKVDIAGIDLQNIHVAPSGKIDDLDVSFKDRSRIFEDSFNYRISTKINRHRSELVPVTLARRLLRTKRTLVLPAHVNLTLITNSYDVVHS